MRREAIDPGTRYARNAQLAKYIGVTPMTIWRWKRNAKLKTPKSLMVGAIEFNDLQEWDDWLRRHAVSRVEKIAS